MIADEVDHRQGVLALAAAQTTAELLERHIIGLIRQDLGKLRGNERLREYVAEELRRVAGSRACAGGQLRQRLAELAAQGPPVEEVGIEPFALDPALAPRTEGRR